MCGGALGGCKNDEDRLSLLQEVVTSEEGQKTLR